MGLCLVLEPSISSSAKKRNSNGSSLNSLFSNTKGGDNVMNVNEQTTEDIEHTSWENGKMTP